MFVKIGDFRKFKGFLVKFPQEKGSEKWTFLSLAFYNAPSLHTVDCPMFSNTVFLGIIPDFGMSAWSAMMRKMRETGMIGHG